MSAETQRVDVLAVMDGVPSLLDFAAAHYGKWCFNGNGRFQPSAHVVESLAGFAEARDAVAELIEAAKQSRTALDACIDALDCCDQDDIDALEVLDRALARIGATP